MTQAFNLTSQYFYHITISISLILTSLLPCSCAQNHTPLSEDAYLATIGDFSKGKELAGNGEYIEALGKFTAVMRSHEKGMQLPDSVLSQTYLYIGSIHAIYHDDGAALCFLTQSARHIPSEATPREKITLYGSLVDASCNIGDFNAAQQWCEAIQRVETTDTARKMFHYLFNKGYVSRHRGDYRRAIPCFLRAARIADSAGMPAHMKLYPYSEIAECHKRLGQADSVSTWLRKTETLAAASGQPYAIAHCHYEMMKWAAENNHRDIAIEYLDKYLDYTDTKLNINDFLAAKESLRLMEADSYVDKIRSRDMTISRQSVWISVTIAIALLVIAILAWRHFLVRRNNRRLYAVNSRLLEQEEILRRELNRTMSATPPHGSAGDEADSSDRRDQESQEILLGKILLAMENKPFRDADFSLQSLADLIGSNSKYVSQTINDLLKKNFRTFINEYRVKEAQRMIDDTTHYGNLSLLGIAQNVGIRSKSSFIEAFRKVTGMTPSAYQRAAREQDSRDNADNSGR